MDDSDDPNEKRVDCTDLDSKPEKIIVKTAAIISIEGPQIALLAQQMRQHVQMLTQNFILSYEHPEFSYMTPKFKNMLVEVKKGTECKTASIFNAVNLNGALELVEQWEEIHTNETKEVLENKAHVEKEIKQSIDANQNTATFPPLTLQTIAKSNVFLYPNLLPRIPFQSSKITKTNLYYFSKSEDNLIALFLEQALPVLKKDPYYITNTNNIRMVRVCKLIHKLLMPHIPPERIRRNIRTKKALDAQDNPIKFFYCNSKAPVIIHRVEELNEDNLLPPCKQKPEVLPLQWLQYIYSNFGIKHKTENSNNKEVSQGIKGEMDDTDSLATIGESDESNDETDSSDSSSLELKTKLGKDHYETKRKRGKSEKFMKIKKIMRQSKSNDSQPKSIKVAIPRLTNVVKRTLVMVSEPTITPPTSRKNRRSPRTTKQLKKPIEPMKKITTPMESSKKRIKASQTTETTETVSLTNDQAFILAQQIRQHIQMLTQNFLLAYQNAELGGMAELLKNMLMDLRNSREGKAVSFFDALNLNNAIELVDLWEKFVASDCKEAIECKEHVDRVLAESIQAKTGGSKYIVTFPPIVMETIANSNVFLYPRLLPPIPFKAHQLTKTRFYHHTESEDNLVALFLEQAIPHLKQDPMYIAPSSKKINMVLVCKLIHKLLMPHLTPYKIRRNIDKKKEHNAQENPIKYFFQNKRAPPITHYVELMDLNNLLPPCKRSLEVLPIQWREFIYSKYHYIPVKRNNVDNVTLQKNNDSFGNNPLIIIASPMQLLPMAQISNTLVKTEQPSNLCSNSSEDQKDSTNVLPTIELSSTKVKTEEFSIKSEYDELSSDDEIKDNSSKSIVVGKIECEENFSNEEGNFLKFQEVKIKCEVHEFESNDIR